MIPTEKCPRCGQVNMATETACLACRALLTAWERLPPEVQQQYTCWRCGGRYTQIVNAPHQGSGCIVAAIGLVFAPVLIGIVLIIIGISMMGETQVQWQCRSCGLTLPG